MFRVDSLIVLNASKYIQSVTFIIDLKVSLFKTLNTQCNTMGRLPE